MQVAFFLLPKSETIYLESPTTIRQAMEKMRHYGYSALPILDANGCYFGTLTSADLLWFIKDNLDKSLKEIGKLPLEEVPRLFDNQPVSINSQVTDLFQMALEQNFIPVVDDLGSYIGIVRRREILEYYADKNGRSLDQQIFAAKSGG